MVDFVIIAVIAAVIGGICFFLRREKKKGVVCVGCPHAKSCGGNCSGGCGSME